MGSWQGHRAAEHDAWSATTGNQAKKEAKKKEVTPSTGSTGYFGTNYLHDGNIGKGAKTLSFHWERDVPFAQQTRVVG